MYEGAGVEAGEGADGAEGADCPSIGCARTKEKDKPTPSVLQAMPSHILLVLMLFLLLPLFIPPCSTDHDAPANPA